MLRELLELVPEEPLVNFGSVRRRSRWMNILDNPRNRSRNHRMNCIRWFGRIRRNYRSWKLELSNRTKPVLGNNLMNGNAVKRVKRDGF